MDDPKRLEPPKDLPSDKAGDGHKASEKSGTPETDTGLEDGFSNNGDQDNSIPVGPTNPRGGRRRVRACQDERLYI